MAKVLRALLAIRAPVLWVLLALGMHCAASADTELVDDRGHTTRWKEPPKRIVSLLPSLTESICALGHCDSLVGVDRYSDWPAEVALLPRTGGGLDPNVEAVVALRPDVVLMARTSMYISRLEALGLKVIAIEPKSHSEVHRALRLLAQLMGQPPAAAENVWGDIEKEIIEASAVARSSAYSVTRPRVYFEVDASLYAAGSVSFIGETLTRLGASNIVPAALGAFPKLNPEFVVRADPDIIMAGRLSVDALRSRPGWQELRAVRLNRICSLTWEQMQLIERPGPRIGQAARLLADCLRRHAAP